MLTGTVLYYYADALPGRNDTHDRSMDSDVTAEYAESASVRFPDRLVQWSCTNGDRLDVRYFRGGIVLTDEIVARQKAYDTAVSEARAAELRRPFTVSAGPGDTVTVQIIEVDAEHVRVSIDGTGRVYKPREMRRGETEGARRAWGQMRKRAESLLAATR